MSSPAPDPLIDHNAGAFGTVLHPPPHALDLVRGRQDRLLSQHPPAAIALEPDCGLKAHPADDRDLGTSPEESWN